MTVVKLWLRCLVEYKFERARLGSAQRVCPDLGPYVAVHLAWNADKNPREVLASYRRAGFEGFDTRKINNVIAGASKFEMFDGVLFRIMRDSVANEVQLRCAVPKAAVGVFEVPGAVQRPLNYRERILLHYHNGPLGGHLGRERTMEIIERDFWRPGMYEDVRRWRRSCDVGCVGVDTHRVVFASVSSVAV